MSAKGKTKNTESAPPPEHVEFKIGPLKRANCTRLASPQEIKCSSDCLPNVPESVSSLRKFCTKKLKGDGRYLAVREGWKNYTNILISEEILYTCYSPSDKQDKKYEWIGIQYKVEAAPYKCPGSKPVRSPWQR
jgi:hypothetical protein